MSINTETVDANELESLALSIHQQIVGNPAIVTEASVTIFNNFLYSTRLEAIVLDCVIDGHDKHPMLTKQILLDENLRSKLKELLARSVYNEVNELAA
jgi:hypothetical protein